MRRVKFVIERAILCGGVWAVSSDPPIVAHARDAGGLVDEVARAVAELFGVDRRAVAARLVGDLIEVEFAHGAL